MRTPKRRNLLQTDRRLDLIDTGLRQTFRALVTGKSPWPLFLHGSAGGGKTRASLFLADCAETSYFDSVEELTDKLMRGDRDENAMLWERIETSELCVLDEIGVRCKVTDMPYTTVKRFADARELHAERRAVYVSNLPPEGIAELFDDRIASRLTCGTIHELKTEDMRFAR